jgi:hypothetical protein
VDDGAAMEEVLRQLAIIAGRRRAEPGWTPPTPAEAAAIMARVEAAARAAS